MQSSAINRQIKVGFIGFGEASCAVVEGWNDSKIAQTLMEISAFDIKTNDALIRDKQWALYKTAGIAGCKSTVEAIGEADVIFSLVTADQVVVAAKNAAACIKTETLYLDCNSCAPQTKQKAGEIINAAGGRYVDVAVIAPIYPKRHQTPVLISGSAARDAEIIMNMLGMSVTSLGGEIGQASSIKMIRSIMVKGMEALTAECVLAARKSGVDEQVLASLENSNPGFGWTTKSAYNLERMMVHGKRRAAEMREVALTVKNVGLNNAMSKAIVEWQQIIGDLQLEPGPDEYGQRADRILDKLASETKVRSKISSQDEEE